VSLALAPRVREDREADVGIEDVGCHRAERSRGGAPALPARGDRG
jgi:hypothetical protein